LQAVHTLALWHFGGSLMTRLDKAKEAFLISIADELQLSLDEVWDVFDMFWEQGLITKETEKMLLND
jgi:hypothetical protein